MGQGILWIIAVGVICVVIYIVFVATMWLLWSIMTVSDWYLQVTSHSLFLNSIPGWKPEFSWTLGGFVLCSVGYFILMESYRFRRAKLEYYCYLLLVFILVVPLILQAMLKTPAPQPVSNSEAAGQEYLSPLTVEESASPKKSNPDLVIQEGKYEGEVIGWNWTTRPCTPAGSCETGEGKIVYTVSLQGNNSSYTRSAEFVYGLNVTSNDQPMQEFAACGTQENTYWHDCFQKLLKEYLKPGGSASLFVSCRSDQGCIASRIDLRTNDMNPEEVAQSEPEPTVIADTSTQKVDRDTTSSTSTVNTSPAPVEQGQQVGNRGNDSSAADSPQEEEKHRLTTMNGRPEGPLATTASTKYTGTLLGWKHEIVPCGPSDACGSQKNHPVYSLTLIDEISGHTKSFKFYLGLGVTRDGSTVEGFLECFEGTNWHACFQKLLTVFMKSGVLATVHVFCDDGQECYAKRIDLLTDGMNSRDGVVGPMQAEVAGVNSPQAREKADMNQTQMTQNGPAANNITEAAVKKVDEKKASAVSVGVDHRQQGKQRQYDRNKTTGSWSLEDNEGASRRVKQPVEDSPQVKGPPVAGMMSRGTGGAVARQGKKYLGSPPAGRYSQHNESIIEKSIIIDGYDIQQLQNIFEFKKSGTSNSWLNIHTGIRYLVIPRAAYGVRQRNGIIHCREAEISMTNSAGGRAIKLMNTCRLDGKWDIRF